MARATLVDSVELLGHRQMRTTMDIYSYVMPELAREAADRMGALLLAGMGIQTATTKTVDSGRDEEGPAQMGGATGTAFKPFATPETTGLCSGNGPPGRGGQYAGSPSGGPCSSTVLAARKPSGIGGVPRRDRRAVLIDGHDAAPGFAAEDKDAGRPDGQVVDVAGCGQVQIVGDGPANSLKGAKHALGAPLPSGADSPPLDVRGH